MEPQAEPTVTFPPLPVPVVNTILRGLSKLSVEEAGSLFFTLQAEAEKQIKAKLQPEPQSEG